MIGPCAIWDFWRGLLAFILLYEVLGAGRMQFGIFWQGFLASILLKVVLGAGLTQFGSHRRSRLGAV